jgi:hypothetical protein
MTTAVHGLRSGRRPWRRKPHGAAEVRGAARVDLRGLDYYGAAAGFSRPCVTSRPAIGCR